MDEVRVIASRDGYSVYGPKKEKLQAVAVDVLIRPGSPPIISLALPGGQIDIAGGAFYAVFDPRAGRARVVKRIEWADGEATDFPVPPQAPAIVTPESGGAAPAAA